MLTQEEISIATDLGLSIDAVEGETADLLRAIDSKLLGLQQETSISTPPQYRELVEARERLRGGSRVRPSQELVLLPTELVSQMLAAIAPRPSARPQAGAKAVRKMKESVIVASTRASQDFRRATLVPYLTTLAAAVSTIVGSQTFFKVSLPAVDPVLWIVAALSALLVASIAFLVALSRRRGDERTLVYLYDADIQEGVLNRIADALIGGDPLPADRAEIVNAADRMAFGRSLFARLLWERAELAAGHRAPHRSTLKASKGGPIDFESALADATQLALGRFADLGLVRPVVVRARQFFELVIDS